MLAALLVTAGVVAVVALATALALAVAGAVHGTPITWTLPGSELAGLLGALAADALMGLAIGLLIGNSAVAIVVYYLIPMILTPLAAWDRVRPVLTWVEPGAINQALTTPGASAEQWQHGAVAALVWIVAPLMAGAWRTLRREAK